MKKHFYGLYLWTIIWLATIPQFVTADMEPVQIGAGGAAEFTGEAGQAPQAEVSELDVSVAEASAYREDVLMTAANNKKGPYLYQKGEFLIIGNDRVAAVFRSANNELAGLIDVGNGGVMLAYGNGPLWRMTFSAPGYIPHNERELEEISSDGHLQRLKITDYRDMPGARKTIEGHPSKPLTTSYSLDCVGQEAMLTLVWSGITIGEEKETVSLQATISADSQSSYLRWNITISNRAVTFGVWDVDFPRFESIMPKGEKSQTGLFLPWGQGRVVDNPFTAEERFVGQYPAPSAPMQYSAIYGPKGGLFLATQDGKMHIKQFVHECHQSAGTITYYLRNFPENRGEAGVGFHMPYDFVLTTFEGDWFDAARLYREWAVKQVWCSGGPLTIRHDVPEWYKRHVFWTVAWEKTHHPNWDEIASQISNYEMVVKDDLTVDGLHKIAATLGVPYGARFHGWAGHVWNTGEGGVEDYFPPWRGEEGFRKQVERIHDADVKIIPYVAPLWAKQLDSYKKRDVFRHCIKDKAGLSYAWRIDMTPRYERAKTKGHPNPKAILSQPIYYLDWPCPYTEFWQNEMAAISRKLVGDYGVDGVYYDVLSGNCQDCFDPNHGHTIGGGNYWAMGNREILRRSRQAIREANPDAIMISEQPSEAYIDVLDSFLLYNVQGMPGAVPAFQTVYHDRILTLGNYIGSQAAIDHLPMFAGESLVHGDQLGEFNVWPMFLPDHPRQELSIYWDDEAKRKKNVDFLVHIARLKHNSGYKFLALGEMLKPLTFKNQLPIQEIKQMPHFSGPRKISAVINAVWKAPDGTLGLVFCNTSESQQQTSYTIDVAAYGLQENKKYIVSELDDKGTSRVVGHYKDAVFSRVENIPARRALILEIKSE